MSARLIGSTGMAGVTGMTTMARAARVVTASVVLSAAAASHAAAQCLAARDGSPNDFQAAGAEVFSTDFSTDSLGEFPRNLEFKSGALEVVERDGMRVLKATHRSAFVIPLTATLPERFSLELGIVNRKSRGVAGPMVQIYGGRVALSDGSASATRVGFGPTYWEVSGGGAKSEATIADGDDCFGEEIIVRLSVDGTRLKLYGDDRRIGSVPNVQFTRGRGIVVQLEGRDDADYAVYLTRLTLAADGGAAVAVAPARSSAQPVPSEPPALRPAPSPEALRPAPSEPAPSQPAPVIESAPVAAPPAQSARTPRMPVLTAPAPAPAPAPEPAPAPAATQSGSGTTTTLSGAARTATGTAPSHRGTSVAGAMAPEVPLAAVTGLTVASLGGGRVAVKWNAVPDAKAYYLAHRPVGQAQWYALHTEPVVGTQYVAHIDSGLRVSPGLAEISIKPARELDDYSSTATTVTRINIPPYMGRYRVTLNGFRVHRETLDNPAETDGKRDEVFAKVTYQEFNADGTPRGDAGTAKSNVYGDINAERWQRPGTENYRWNAGRASARGGLMSGDGVPRQADPWVPNTVPSNKTFPLFIWEGTLVEGDNTVNIAPLLYEDDETQEVNDPAVAAIRSFGALLALHAPELVSLPNFGALQAASPKPVSDKPKIDTKSALAFAKSVAVATNWVQASYRARVLQLANNAVSAYTAAAPDIAMAVALVANSRTRPIGVTGIAGGKMVVDPVILPLTFRRAEEIVTTKDPNSDVPAGIVAIRYTDTVPGGSGDYTLYLQVQRLP